MEFSHLSTIKEVGSRAGGALSASTASMDEKDAATNRPHSWLTDFLIDAHLSAPSRRWEANSIEDINAHIGSDTNHG